MLREQGGNMSNFTSSTLHVISKKQKKKNESVSNNYTQREILSL